MNLGRHPLTVDDELIPRATDVQLGNFVLVGGLGGGRKLRSKAWMND